ncbi:MAG: hypothetical protein ABJB86_22875 [Bacteroidota bacterium]
MMEKKNNGPAKYTKESLQQEQRRLRLIIQQQEADLRGRVQKIPGELLYAGVDSVLPAVLTGKISNKILTISKNFVNKSIVKKANGNTSRLVTVAKQAGIFTLLKFGYNMLMKKKS